MMACVPARCRPHSNSLPFVSHLPDTSLSWGVFPLAREYFRTRFNYHCTINLVGQLDAAVRGHWEGRVPRHLPQEAVGIREETVAPEEDLLCLLDYRGSGFGGLCEHRVYLPLLGHVVRQREARDPAMLHILYVDARVDGERRPREEGDHHPTRLEERHLVAAHAGLGPSQSVAVEGDRAL